MPNQVAASLDSIRNLLLVDNGDGTFSLAVSNVGGGGGAASEVEGTRAEGSAIKPKPVVVGFINQTDDGDVVASLIDVAGTGAPQMSILGGVRPAGSMQIVNPVVVGAYNSENGEIIALATDESGNLNIAIPNTVSTEAYPIARTLNFNDYSGSIDAGGTPQLLIGSSTGERAHILFQNLSDTAMYIRFETTTPAVGPGWRRVPAGDTWEMGGGFVCGAAFFVVCASSGKEFTCWTFNQ